MISSIAIQNFETHINTNVELHAGVNTFVGESDEGKSGIVRSILWNARNRPRGDEYRNDQLDPKTKEDKLKITEVGIVYKGTGLVVRGRDGFSGGVNHYQIDNKEPLRALRTDVPDEVQEVTRMKDVNIQGQHPTEQYFLLADKPGQVAREFNKVSGLSIIDDTTSEINKQVRETNSTLKVVKKEIDDRELQLKNMEWVPKAISQATKLKIKKTKLKKATHKIENLDSLLEQLDYVNDKLKGFDNLDEAMMELEAFKLLDNKIWAAANKQKSISDTIDGLKTIDTQLKASNGIEDAVKELKQLEKLDSNIMKHELFIVDIDNQLTDIDKTKSDIDKFNQILLQMQKEFDKKVISEICPTCGRSDV